MVKLHITYPKPEDGIHGESPWATPLKNGHYRLENQPLFEGLFFGDIVTAEYIDGDLEFQSLKMRVFTPEDDFENSSDLEGFEG